MPQGQYPVLVAGQDMTAGTIQAFAPFFAWKTSDTSVTSSTTLISDPDITLPVVANAFYQFECVLDYEGASGLGNGIQWQWTVPGLSTLRYSAIFTRSSDDGNITGGCNTAGTNLAGIANGAGALCGATMLGTLFTGVTTGNIVLQWSQAGSSSTATILHAQSYMKLQRLA